MKVQFPSHSFRLIQKINVGKYHHKQILTNTRDTFFGLLTHFRSGDLVKEGETTGQRIGFVVIADQTSLFSSLSQFLCFYVNVLTYQNIYTITCILLRQTEPTTILQCTEPATFLNKEYVMLSIGYRAVLKYSELMVRAVDFIMRVVLPYKLAA